MLRNYFKTAFRNILRNKTFSLINVFGLSLSLAVCLVIIMIVSDQLSMDRHVKDADRIFRVNTQKLHDDGPVNINATSPLPIGGELMDNYTGITEQVRIRRGFGNGWIGIENDSNIPLGGFYADPQFINFFSYELESGNAQTALVEPYSVVLTKKASIKLFGDNEPIGEVIDMGDIGDYKVTGVLADSDQKSHIVFEALASMSTTDILEKDSTLYNANGNWNSTTAGWVYIKLDENKSTSEVIDHLVAIDEKYYADKKLVDYRFLLQNLLDINPGPLIGNQIGPGLPMIFVYFLGGLALLVMISACFNYTNLSIAKSINRAKEVGVRKVSGAMKSQIFAQFLLESVLIALCSLVFAYVIVVITEPAFYELKLVSLLQWELAMGWKVIAFSILFSLLVGIIAGLFPSVVLSAFQPIKVLKDMGNMKLFSKLGLRKVLLTAQLALSLFFIISVVLIYNQLTLMVTTDKGFNAEQIINIPLIKTDGEQFRTELEKQSYVQAVTLASHIPASGTSRGEYFKRNLEDERIDINYFTVDQGYLELMDIQLLAGRDIDYEVNKEHERELLINEKAISALGFESVHAALGATIFTEDSLEVSIVGVVENYHHQMMMQEIGPLAIRFIPGDFGYAHVKIHEGSNEKAEAQILDAWRVINPTKQMEYKYLDAEIQEYYDMLFGDLAKLISVFSFLALTVASLGLLGMAIYTTNSRIKEVSIRKVLGASNQNVIYILSKGFVKLIGWSILFAVPLAYFVNNLWLQNLATRTNISFGVVFFSTLILTLLSAIIIGSQTVRAGHLNPAESLKNE